MVQSQITKSAYRQMRRTLTLFFWSAEEIFLLRREKIFPLRSRKSSSVLKFRRGKMFVCCWKHIYIKCFQQQTRIRQQKKSVYYLFAVLYDDAAEAFAYPLSVQVVTKRW